MSKKRKTPSTTTGGSIPKGKKKDVINEAELEIPTQSMSKAKTTNNSNKRRKVEKVSVDINSDNEEPKISSNKEN